MHPLEKVVANVIKKEKLIRPGEIVLAGVSGGPDSMAMLHVLADLRESFGFLLHAAYVDHGLRPQESDEEVELLRKQADMLNISSHFAREDVPGYAKNEGLSTEDAARRLRYGFFDSIAGQINAAKIAVAHTADDQAEEVLLRLIRGTGKKGLSGMDFVRAGRIIRPLLTTPKQKLIGYLHDKDIPYLEDSSNRQRNFLRNRIRLDLLPYLEKHFNPSIRKTLRQMASILSVEEEYLDEVSATLYKEIVDERVEGKGPQEIIFAAVTLQKAPKAIQQRIVEKVFWQMSCKPGFKQIGQVIDRLDNKNDGFMHFSKGLRASFKNGMIHFSYPEGMTSKRGNLGVSAKQSFSVEIIKPGKYRIDDINYELHFEILDNKGIDLKKEHEKGRSVDFLEADALRFPLLVRSPLPGDRFHPLGAPGSKKVNDWLTDKKVARQKRWQVPVLVAGDRILALLGRRIDHRYRITRNTGKVLKVTMEYL